MFSLRAPRQPAKLMRKVIPPTIIIANDTCNTRCMTLSTLSSCVYPYSETSSENDQAPKPIRTIPMSQNMKLKKNNEYLTHGDMIDSKSSSAYLYLLKSLIRDLL